MKTIAALVGLAVSIATGLFFLAVFIVASVWLLDKVYGSTPEGQAKAIKVMDTTFDLVQAAIILAAVIGVIAFVCHVVTTS